MIREGKAEAFNECLIFRSWQLGTLASCCCIWVFFLSFSILMRVVSGSENEINENNEWISLDSDSQYWKINRPRFLASVVKSFMFEVWMMDFQILADLDYPSLQGKGSDGFLKFWLIWNMSEMHFDNDKWGGLWEWKCGNCLTPEILHISCQFSLRFVSELGTTFTWKFLHIYFRRRATWNVENVGIC